MNKPAVLYKGRGPAVQQVTEVGHSQAVLLEVGQAVLLAIEAGLVLLVWAATKGRPLVGQLDVGQGQEVLQEVDLGQAVHIEADQGVQLAEETGHGLAVLRVEEADQKVAHGREVDLVVQLVGGQGQDLQGQGLEVEAGKFDEMIPIF